jgi:glycosyltransferase involved in cell wall biosynthesis
MNSISVIIPVYNGAPYLAEAIESVLTQTQPPAEIIVVDDGSTDDSAKIARTYGPPIRCLQQAKSGQSAARNRGIEQAAGDLLAFLDADDLWLPDKLEHQTAALSTTPYPDMVFGQVEQFCSPSVPANLQFSDAGRVMNGLHIGAMLIKAEAFHRVGPLRTDLSVGEFVDWYSRAQGKNLVGQTLPVVVVRRRLHEHNMMRHARNMDRDYLNILRRAVHRRRDKIG